MSTAVAHPTWCAGRSLLDGRSPRARPSWERALGAVRARDLVQKGLIVPTARALCRPLRVEGVEQLALLKQPALFIANHSSHLDVPVVLAALPSAIRRRFAVAAAEDYFYAQPAMGLALSLTIGTFPFPRRGRCTAGLERAEALLGEGWNVLMFPEGTRSADGRLQPFRRGAVRLLCSTTVSAVPIGIVGTAAALPRGASVPRPDQVIVRFGPPWRPEPAQTIDEITSVLHTEIVRLTGL